MKIGWTTDPTKRLSNMQLANPDKVAIAALMRGGGREEAVLHRAFAALHHRAEWFREEGALAELVGLIGELGAEASRYVAGDWFLKKFGKTDLLYEDQTAQKPDHGTAES